MNLSPVERQEAHPHGTSGPEADKVYQTHDAEGRVSVTCVEKVVVGSANIPPWLQKFRSEVA